MKKISGVVIIAILLMTALAGCAGSKKNVPRESGHHGSRGHRYFLSGDMPMAIGSYKTGFAAARKADDGAAAAQYLSNIGRVYYELGQIDSAALYFAKAHEEFGIYGDKSRASKSAAFLALCFASNGDAVSARRWFDAAVSSVDTDKNKKMKHYYAVIKNIVDFKLTSNIGDESALDATFMFYKKKKNHSALTTIYSLKADAELSKGNRPAAARHLNDALSSNDKTHEVYKRSRMLLALAKINFYLGDEKTGRHYYERAHDCTPKGMFIPPMDEI